MKTVFVIAALFIFGSACWLASCFLPDPEIEE